MLPRACRATIAAIPVCLVGVILITQPPALGMSDGKNRSYLGMACACGQVSSCCPPDSSLCSPCRMFGAQQVGHGIWLLDYGLCTPMSHVWGHNNLVMTPLDFSLCTSVPHV